MSRDTWRDALAAYASPATLALLLLGFAAGLPAVLVSAGKPVSAMVAA